MAPNRMNKKLKAQGRLLGVGVTLFGVGVLGVSAFVTPEWNVSSEQKQENVAEDAQEQNDKPSAVSYGTTDHIPTPEPMYAIYMSQCVVGTPSFRADLVDLIERTSLNAVVIDIKDYSGTIAFETKDKRFEDAALANCGARDMAAFIQELHDKNIYVIGRITVFQDPFYTKKFPEQAVQSISRPGEPWEDHKGLAFVDVSSTEFWEYIVALSKEAYAVGFDELNYDYVRYPSDGNMKDAQYVNDNKAEALETFFAYLHEHVAPIGVVMSADLFGYTTVLTDDLGIGQQLERALPYFDYIAPMVYPSHYNSGFAGLSNPNSDPYKVIYTSMVAAVERARATETTVATLDSDVIYRDEIVPATDTTPTTTKKVATGYYTKPVHDKLKLRPWLQDFDYGKDYTPEDIRAQIQATYDAGLTSWFFWDPANRYESLEAYLLSL